MKTGCHRRFLRWIPSARQSGIVVATIQIYSSIGDTKMDKLEFNIGISLFVVGAIIFLLAPSGLLASFRTDDLSLTGLFIESIGIVSILVVHFRDKIVGLYLE